MHMSIFDVDVVNFLSTSIETGAISHFCVLNISIGKRSLFNTFPTIISLTLK